MYQGQFADGKYEGHGVFTKADKTKYEGEFKHGKVKNLFGVAVHLE